jgi:hypothetical protein
LGGEFGVELFGIGKGGEAEGKWMEMMGEGRWKVYQNGRPHIATDRFRDELTGENAGGGDRFGMGVL